MINYIVVGDACDVCKKLKSDSVDLVVTSPPYNFSMNYDVHDDSMSFKDYYDLIEDVAGELFRAVKPSGRVAINIMPKWDKDSPTHHIITEIMRMAGFTWFGEIVWLKPYKHSTAWGSWASPSSPSFISNRIEFVELFYKGMKTKAGDKGDIDITKEEFLKWIQAVWEVDAENGMVKKYNHPAVFPEEIPMRLIKLLSYKGDVVLDPFNGAGTTTKVAYDLERKYIGIDLSEEYCKTAVRRIRKEEKKNPLLARKYDNTYSKVKLLKVDEI